MAILEKRKRPIVVTAAHADTMQCTIKSDKWNEYAVEFFRRANIAAEDFPDTKTVLAERRVWLQFGKKHSAVAQNFWCEHGFASLPGEAHDSVDVDFIVARKIDRNASGVCKAPRADQLSTNGCRRTDAIVVVETAPGSEALSAQDGC